MEFQIKENYGGGSGSYSYFTANGDESIDQLEKMAIEVVIKDWQTVCSVGYILHTPTPPKPTIYVYEYDNIKHCVVKNGIKFKTKWTKK